MNRTKLTCAAALLLPVAAHAALSVSYQFNGNGNWSIDAVGSNNDPVGVVSASVPAGSTVVKAFLYSAHTPGVTNVPQIDFAGTAYSGPAWTYLGANTYGLNAYRADVTAQVAAAIGTGGATPFDFSVRELAQNTQTDGEMLAVVYSNPGEAERTIAFLDGFSQTTGDSFQFNFASPLANIGDPSFEAQMSLGISFSYQLTSNQASQVTVNGTRLTSWAGGEDDGASYDGGLITAGGLGDSPSNPADPYAINQSIRYDDELYDIEPFLANGDTGIQIRTLNPSNNDNIFFSGFNITATGDVTSVPDGGTTVGLLGLALLGLLPFRKQRVN